ncbi:unnamed protein product [Urochloa decumbens]|uniref:Gnk2-homologous domain-containing protein n=1 Tax=Urochloa decumbens TaxID=240449 RepID=A0ABC9BQS9_9POAL
MLRTCTGIDRPSTMAMASSARAPPLFLPSIMLLSLLLLASSHAATTPPNTVVCNDNTFAGAGAFAVSLAQLLKDLVSATPWAAGHDLYQSLPSEAPIVFGHAACRPGLKGEDCKSCLGYAMTQMVQMCPNGIGGRAAKADDCSIRYENYAFTD